MSSTMETRGAQAHGRANDLSHHPRTTVSTKKIELQSGTTNRTIVPVNEQPWQIMPARPGDHHLACHLLASVQRAPSSAEFQAQLEDPHYEPNDRLLCRMKGELIGHARFIKREMRFGSAVLPVTMMADTLVLPEFRQKGCGSALLSTAERTMADDGAFLGITRTHQPHFYLRRGWSVWSRHSYSTAGAREILSQLLQAQDPKGSEESKDKSPLNIRWWRHIELPGLMRLYSEKMQHAYGALIRSESYWQWLLARRAYDRIYVAILGPDRLELDEAAAAMVGYAVMKEGRILELMASAAYPQAAEGLLARACSDAIEQDGNYVRLDAPVGDPLHHVVARAGGELGYHESVHGEVCLIKLFDFEKAFEVLGEQVHGRAKQAGLTLPTELGFQVDGEKFVLEIRPRSTKLRIGRMCRSYLECGRAELTQLLLGHLDLKLAIAGGRVHPSTRTAGEIAGVLFPTLPLWRPPWDELPAR